MNLSGKNRLIYYDSLALKDSLYFIYSSWSPTRVCVEDLIKFLDNFPLISLVVLDIDGYAFKKISTKHGIQSHGWGDVFFIRENKIIFSITDYYKEREKLKEFIQNFNVKF